VEGKQVISYDDANKIILEELTKIEKRILEVDLLDSLGRILAEDVFSDTDQPPFDNSAMDGIAIKFRENIRSWKLVGEISAGNFSEYNLDENSCARIMTGGKIPESADSVIPLELFEDSGEKITLLSDVEISKGSHIREKGSDLFVGMKAVGRGVKIRSNHISMLSACGKSKVKVYDKIKIGLLVTGDELVEIDQKPSSDKIRATNLYTLLSAIKEGGHEPINFGLVGDDRDLTEQKVKSALDSDIDFFITTGGVSVGKYDFIKDVLLELGMEEKFWRVNIKPGKPVLFGTFNKNNKTKMIYGLPGNPVSSFVTFNIFVKNNIDKYFNFDNNNKIIAELTLDLKKKDSKRHFSRGILTYDENAGKYYVSDAGSVSSGNMASLSNANCLIIIEENRTFPKNGEMIKCIKI
jgi:molybdopterin molybdotransferase